MIIYLNIIKLYEQYESLKSAGGKRETGELVIYDHRTFHDLRIETFSWTDK